MPEPRIIFPTGFLVTSFCCWFSVSFAPILLGVSIADSGTYGGFLPLEGAAAGAKRGVVESPDSESPTPWVRSERAESGALVLRSGNPVSCFSEPMCCAALWREKSARLERGQTKEILLFTNKTKTALPEERSKQQ